MSPKCRGCPAIEGRRRAGLCSSCYSKVSDQKNKAHGAGAGSNVARTFTPEEVAEAKSMRSRFKTFKEIGDHFGISNPRAAKLVKEGK